ncbi:MULTISPECIES: type IV pilus modification PilV family protein [Thiorhodovibrio]|uniref:type IV pilus modification PilV family protein n=1 Tax=Thiorhodovibrio TaxID=61593 RepID=UPI001911FBB7|nr:MULTISPECIES: prepilin-type N-terminal cleavage/methylation domain-containing protein [Thiorhodovibrio]MBK5971209.1 hypothetical protein [Thiorhodovibrio winogradskyi]WPL14642.1 type II secretion system protein I [Thiorhodovibrio litoralis]
MSRCAQSGFSLLEVMVAFAILALSLGVLLQIFSSSMNATSLSLDYARAAVVAESRLNSVGLDIPLSEGTYSGDPEQGIDWIVHIGASDLAAGLESEGEFRLFSVRSVATWPGRGSGRSRVVLESLRLSRVSP